MVIQQSHLIFKPRVYYFEWRIYSRDVLRHKEADTMTERRTNAIDKSNAFVTFPHLSKNRI